MCSTPMTGDGFKQHLSQVTTNAFTSLGIYYGIKIGLFEVMASFDEPKSVQEIADAAGCKARYVQELLGLLVIGKVVTIDGENQTYLLPQTYREALLGVNGMLAGFLPSYSSVFDDVLECFKKDGPPGLTQAKYGPFYEYFGNIKARLYTKDYVSQMMKFEPCLKEKLESGIKVCEIGCSVGVMLCSLAEVFPKSEFVGTDLLEESIKVAKKSASEKNIQNATFEMQDIFKLSDQWNGQFDVVIIVDVIHDLPYPLRAMQQIKKLLKSDGTLLIVEFHTHSNQVDNISSDLGWLYGASMLSCVPWALNHEGATALGAPWGKEKAQELISESGYILKNSHVLGLEIIYTCTPLNE